MAGPPLAAIEVEGWWQLRRDIRRAADTGMNKRLGQANKKVGEFVIQRLRPTPTPATVGEGRGASVRSSATKSAVVLRAGGAHRARGATSAVEVKRRQWGIRPVQPFRRSGERPYIKETAERHRDDIYEFWLDAIGEAMWPAFYDVEV